jgi:hypothetical protein
LQSILSGFHFRYADPSWKPGQEFKLSETSVLCGSAYCIFDEPPPAPSNYLKIAEQIRDGFMRLYDLKAASSGGGGVQTTNTTFNTTGEAHFIWTDAGDDAAHSKKLIFLSVRVFPLVEAKLGVVLPYVRIQPDSAAVFSAPAPQPRLQPSLSSFAQPTYEVRTLATGNLSNIRLNACFGLLTFTVAGVEYSYFPHSIDPHQPADPAASALACMALLDQLRKVETFEVRVPVLPYLPSDSKKVNVEELTIPFAALK